LPRRLTPKRVPAAGYSPAWLLTRGRSGSRPMPRVSSWRSSVQNACSSGWLRLTIPRGDRRAHRRQRPPRAGACARRRARSDEAGGGNSQGDHHRHAHALRAPRAAAPPAERAQTSERTAARAGDERPFARAAPSVHGFVQALSSFADLTTVWLSCTERPPPREEELSSADGFDLEGR
jgi:hypothetical protein